MVVIVVVPVLGRGNRERPRVSLRGAPRPTGRVLDGCQMVSDGYQMVSDGCQMRLAVERQTPELRFHQNVTLTLMFPCTPLPFPGANLNELKCPQIYGNTDHSAVTSVILRVPTGANLVQIPQLQS